MNPAELATAITAALAPLLATSLNDAIKTLSKDAYQQLKNLKDWLWGKIALSGEKKIQQAAGNFESDPDTYQDVMAKVLADYLQRHPEDAQEIARRLQLVQIQPSTTQIVNQTGTQNAVSFGHNSSITQNNTATGLPEQKGRKPGRKTVA